MWIVVGMTILALAIGPAAQHLENGRVIQHRAGVPISSLLLPDDRFVIIRMGDERHGATPMAAGMRRGCCSI